MGAVEKIYVQIGGNTAGLAAALGQAGKQVEGFAGKMTTMGKSLTKNLTLPIVAIGAASVYAFANFEDALNQTFAIMGDLSDDMKSKMSDAAREIAKTTTFSAEEAASAYYDLASSGMDAATVIEALPKVAAFAQAGMMDLSTATGYLTDAQNALGLKTGEVAQDMTNLQRVADVLTQANNMAAGSIEDFSAALTNKAAAALRMVNKSVEEGVAVLMVYASQGVKGEEAGEKLAIVLRDLQTQAIGNAGAFKKYNLSVFDAQGNMRNMADITGDLEKALSGMSDEQKRATLMELGFQDRSVAAMLSLMGFSDEIRNYQGALENAGGATQEVADKQMDSFKAKLDVLKNKFVDVGISIGERLVPAIEGLMPTFEKIGGFIATLVAAFSSLPQPVQTAIVALLAVAAVAGPIMSTFNTIKSGFQAVQGAVTSLMANPSMLAFLAIAATAAAIGYGISKMVSMSEDNLNAMISVINGVKDAWDGLTRAEREATIASLEHQRAALAAMGGTGEAVAKLDEEIANLKGSLDTSARGLGIFSDNLEELKEGSGEVTTSVMEMKDEMVEAGKLMAKEGNKLATEVVQGLRDIKPSIVQASQFAVEGFFTGYLGTWAQNVPDVEAKTVQLAEILKAQDLNTPAGQAAVQAFIAGLNLEGPNADAAATDLARKLGLPMPEGGINAAGEFIGTFNPTLSGNTAYTNVDVGTDPDSLVSRFMSRVQAALDATKAIFHIESSGGGSVPVEGAGATGAIVNRPTIALIGEHGREAVVPLDQTSGNGPLRGFASADNTTITMTGDIYLPNATDFKSFVREAQLAGLRLATGA